MMGEGDHLIMRLGWGQDREKSMKSKIEAIKERLAVYKEEVKSESKKHSILLSEDRYIEDVGYLLNLIIRLGWGQSRLTN